MKKANKIPDSILYPQGSVFKFYRVIYEFRHSKMGFQNSITTTGLSPEHALQNARNDVSGAYGSKMLSRFTFKIDPSYTPKPITA